MEEEKKITADQIKIILNKLGFDADTEKINSILQEEKTKEYYQEETIKILESWIK